MITVNIDDFEIFCSNKANLKELSVDKSISPFEYMSDSEILATDFDEVKRQYTNNLGHSENDANSVDALFESSDKLIFVEFKNGVVNKQNVRWKGYDSLLIFCDITKTDIEWMRNNAVYIVVYNAEKNKDRNMVPSQLDIEDYLFDKAKEKVVRFGLNRFEGLFYHKVYTFTKDEFRSYLRCLFD